MMATDTADARLERVVGRVLRVGVRASTACLVIGLVLSLFLHPSSAGSTLMTVGLLILMATPVARVAASIAEYASERDWLFVALTTLVLLEIGAGVVTALVFHRRM
jgi:uncharacterized membrane protein